MNKKTTILTILAFAMIMGLPISAFQMVTSQPAKSNPEKLNIRVACVGDSITEISGYTTDLQSRLGSNYVVGNFGVSGSTVCLNSFKPYMNQTQCTEAKNFNPDIVIIMLGTNDAHWDTEHLTGNFEQDYALLANSFQQLDGSPQVVIVKSPPVFNNNMGIDPNYFSASIIPSIQNVADQQNLPLIDVYNAFGNRSDFTLDGVHPNNDGAALIASTICDAITLQDYIDASMSD